jgi:hypothetical protein
MTPPSSDLDDRLLLLHEVPINVLSGSLVLANLHLAKDRGGAKLASLFLLTRLDIAETCPASAQEAPDSHDRLARQRIVMGPGRRGG